MNDKTKSQVEIKTEAEELTDEELKNVHGGAGDIYLGHLFNGVEGESTNALDKASKSCFTTGYKR